MTRFLVFLGSARDSTPPAPARLGWWAEAAARHRDIRDPSEVSPAFQRAPDQRNAPASG